MDNDLIQVGDSISVIDIGSNSIRMIVSEKTSENSFKVTKLVKLPITISEGSYQNYGKLQEEALNKARHGLKSFSNISKNNNVKAIHCVATSAMRDALSKHPEHTQSFINEINEKYDINITVIDGNAEALYGGIAVANTLPVENCVTMDIGGGSTEFALIKNGEVVETISLNLGTVRLKELFFDTNDLSGAKKYLKSELSKIPESFKSKKMVALGGTSRAISKLIMSDMEYPLETAHAFEFNREEYRPLWKKIVNEKDYTKIKVKEDRQRVIREGTLIFATASKFLEIEDIMISQTGVREGVAISKSFHDSPYFNKDENISVENIKRKLNIDSSKSDYFSEKSMELFNTLKDKEEFLQGNEKVLKIAAQLYPAGKLFSVYNESSNGYSLTKQGLEYQLTHSEILTIAEIIKMQEKIDFEQYTIPDDLKELLPEKEVLQRLAFIIKVINAITVEDSYPEDVTFDIIKDKLVISGEYIEESMLIQKSLKRLRNMDIHKPTRLKINKKLFK